MNHILTMINEYNICKTLILKGNQGVLVINSWLWLYFVNFDQWTGIHFIIRGKYFKHTQTAILGIKLTARCSLSFNFSAPLKHIGIISCQIKWYFLSSHLSPGMYTGKFYDWIGADILPLVLMETLTGRKSFL